MNADFSFVSLYLNIVVQEHHHTNARSVHDALKTRGKIKCWDLGVASTPSIISGYAPVWVRLLGYW